MAVNRLFSVDKHSEKYSNLMIPIRDLAKNWNVDVASLLEDYLSELGYVRISFDDDPNGDTMNFAEAALLIQNSACVYSKKVDYLFNLVVQLLDHLKCRSANQITSKKKVVLKNIKPDDDFPSYDDLVADNNLKLKESLDEHVDLNAFTITRMPLQFLSFCQDETTSFPLYNTKGQLVGNRHDFKVNCWQSPFYKFICEEISSLAEANNCISMQTNDHEAEPILGNTDDHLAIQDAAEELNSPMTADDDRADDPGFDHASNESSDAENGNEEVIVRPPSPEIQKNSLAVAAEKALREWDPVYAHENIKQRLRPFRKAKETFKPSIVSKRSLKKQCRKTKSTMRFCSENLFSRASNMPSQMVEESRSAEALTKLISKQVEKKSDLKSSDDINGSDNEEHGIEDGDKLINDDASCSYSDNEADIDNFSVSSFEGAAANLDTTYDVISQKTDEFLKLAREQTELNEGEIVIRKWEEYLSGKLEEEDKYVSYNVREYTTKVLKAFRPNSAKQTLAFSQIVSDKPNKGELSRLFFATLQLANNYNIAINQEQQNHVELDNIEVTLLSRNQNFDRFENN